jgi:NitT/TauT family transport system substrate-binding protein
MIGLIPEAASAEPPPETKTIRLIYDPDDGGALCYAPTWVAADLLRAEGFTDVRFVKMIEKTNVEPPTLAAGQADMSGVFGPDLIMGVDAGLPVVGLAGLHGGCLELVGSERVRTIRDLNGKKIAVSALGVTDHLFIANMLAYIGMNPRKDVQWVVHEPPESIRLLAQGKVDALLAFPPMPQQLRAKKIGHVLLRTAEDPPWSQYICCMLVASKQFVQNSPVATKRAIRAVLKSDQLCMSEPERSARFLVDKKLTLGASYQETLQTLKDVRYGPVWREYDPESALVFHALRMRENGFIKSTPQEDHRPGHRLALPRRAEEGIEGVVLRIPWSVRRTVRP